MNILEKKIHNLISEYPYIRKPLVNIYQRIFSLIPIQKSEIDRGIIIRPGYFFGFHDKKPWHPGGDHHLSHYIQHDFGKMESEIHPLTYGYFEDSQLSKYVLVGETKTWNWQQGASLQWLGNTNKFIVNDAHGNTPISKIHNLNNTASDILPFHVASINHSGKLAITYCFTRFGKGTPGYGYRNFMLEQRKPEITIIDLSSGIAVFAIDIHQIKLVNEEESMVRAFNFFSHGLFSPASDIFLFFHRWVEPITSKLYTRLFSYNMQNRVLYHYPLENCSHISWYGGNEILAYCKPTKRPWGYYMTPVESDEWQTIAPDISSSDGHPQCLFDKKIFVSDTYPNRYRLQRLYLHNLENQISELVVELKIPFKFRGAYRCDFHPRIHDTGTKISFDSAHTGTRSLCIIELD